MKILQNIEANNGEKANAGFTLVENAVALTIVSVMLTSMYGAFANGFTTLRTTRESQRATQIMLSRLERVRLCNYDQLTNTVYNPSTFSESFNPTDEAAGNGGVTYSGTFTTSMPPNTIIPDAYRTNMLLITVSVSWTSGSMNHTRSMMSYASRDGMESYVSVGK